MMGYEKCVVSSLSQGCFQKSAIHLLKGSMRTDGKCQASILFQQPVSNLLVVHTISLEHQARGSKGHHERSLAATTCLLVVGLKAIYLERLYVEAPGT